jgi:membrane-bound lytic murein transglycosylase D
LSISPISARQSQQDNLSKTISAKGYININFGRYSFALELPKLVGLAYAGLFNVGCSALGGSAGIAEESMVEVAVQVESQSIAVPIALSVSEPTNATDSMPLLSGSNDVDESVVAETDLWSKVRDDMQLDHRVEEKRVSQELRWLQQNPEYWNRLAPRMQRYLPYIYQEVSARNLPAELVLLPVIESALDPYAFSPYGANGLWQFMRPTAKQYGLIMTENYDGRRDVVASTAAALDFLQDLYRRFDDWPLALAAYNAGGGTVSKALRRSDSRDFFRQRLPRETQAYVPRLLAISAIVANPEAYGVALPNLESTNPLLVLKLPTSFDVSVVAQVLEMNPDQIYEFNPALKQARWSEADSLQLIVPNTWQENSKPSGKSAEIPMPPDAHQPASMPNTFNAAPALNDAKTEALARLRSVPPEERMAWLTVVVRSGDTLSDIANTHGLTTGTLRRLNQLDSDLLQIGHKIRVPMSLNIRQPGEANLPTYTVRQGDSLWLIAKRFRTSVTTLVKLNEIGPRDLLSIGQNIVLPSTSAQPLLQDAPPNKIRKIRYRVRRGDSLSRIAQRFRLRVEHIVEWNDLQPKRYLQPGQGLTLYVDVIGG